MNPPTEALSAAGVVEAKAKTASPRLRAAPRGSVAITATNSRTDRIPVQKLCIARSTRRLPSLPAFRLAKALRAKVDPLHSATVRSDTARTNTAAIGIPATSAMVAVQAIQEASSAEIEKPPPMSAIPRSTSWEEMVEPTVASAMTPIVSIATGSGGRGGAETAGLRSDACTDCGAEISQAIACTGAFGTRPPTNCRFPRSDFHCSRLSRLSRPAPWITTNRKPPTIARCSKAVVSCC